jgi:hypothetical protein
MLPSPVGDPTAILPLVAHTFARHLELNVFLGSGETPLAASGLFPWLLEP